MALTRTAAWRLRSFGAFACLAALLAGGVLRPGFAFAQSPSAQSPSAAKLAGHGSDAGTTLVEGFRQARFGMSESEVRQAIRRDFPAAAERLSRTTQPREKTVVLALTAEELLPDTGPAQLSYILGYASKRLVQVNIVWSSDGRSAARDEAIVTAANTLRDHFQAQYPAPPNVVVANQRVVKNTFLVFRAAQVDGRMVVVVLSGVAAAGRAGATSPPPPLTLQLAYIRDSRNPDIFHIDPGRF